MMLMHMIPCTNLYDVDTHRCEGEAEDEVDGCCHHEPRMLTKETKHNLVKKLIHREIFQLFNQFYFTFFNC